MTTLTDHPTTNGTNPTLVLPHIPTAAITAAIPEIDGCRRLPTSLVSALANAGLFRLYTPAEHGGTELDPEAFCTVVEDVARLDGSVAWCVWNGNTGFAASLLEPAAAELVFGHGDAVGNSARVAGTAVPVEGGYRLSGRWDLVSGSDHQPWFILFGIVTDGETPRFVAPGVPDVRAFFVPNDQCSIVDRWHVLGLRATSSNEVVAAEVFVPEALAPSPFAPSRIDRTLYRVPVFTTASCGGAAVCLGIARGAIEDLMVLAATKTSVRDASPIATHADVQATIAECDIELRGSRAAFHETLATVVATAAAGSAPVLVERARVRAAMTHAARTARSVTLRMFELGSSTAIYDGNTLQRRLRDVLVAAQHMMLQPIWFEETGRAMLGLETTLPIL